MLHASMFRQSRFACLGIMGLVFCSFAGAAPRLILNDNAASECLLGNEVRIASDTGDLHVDVANLEACLPSGSGLAVSPVVVSPASLLPPGEVQVVWSSVGAERCDAAGTLPAWNSVGELPLQGSRTLSVPIGSAADTYRLDVRCAANGQQTPEPTDDNLVIASPDAPLRPSLDVAPATVVQGGSVTVTWLSQNADGCSAGGDLPGWSGDKSASGTEQVAVAGSLPASSYSLTLTCSNSGGASQPAEASVVVQAVVPQVCSGNRAPPPGLSRATSCLLSPQSGDCTQYAAIFGGVPGTTALKWFFGAQNSYAAMEIGPTDIPALARVNMGSAMLQNPYASYAAGPVLWSISSCPGDFNSQAIAEEMGPGCVRASVMSFIVRFGGIGFRDDPGVCALESGKRYFLNILYTSQQAGTPNSDLIWTCPAANCGHQLQAGPSGW